LVVLGWGGAVVAAAGAGGAAADGEGGGFGGWTRLRSRSGLGSGGGDGSGGSGDGGEVVVEEVVWRPGLGELVRLLVCGVHLVLRLVCGNCVIDWLY